MEKVLSIVNLKDRKTDFASWSTKTDLERLEALEVLKQQYITHHKNAQQGFQKEFVG